MVAIAVQTPDVVVNLGVDPIVSSAQNKGLRETGGIEVAIARAVGKFLHQVTRCHGVWISDMSASLGSNMPQTISLISKFYNMAQGCFFLLLQSAQSFPNDNSQYETHTIL